MTRALIIEDNPDNMLLIQDLLEANGFKTLEAYDGFSGIEMVREQNPDFIILDIQLPDIDGYEVLRRLRSAEINAPMPIIAMTSFAMSGDRERLLNAGCNGYIEKPIDPMRVVDQIKQILDLSKCSINA
ncbi:response regulator [Magnetococcales bacterium HHB-1]